MVYAVLYTGIPGQPEKNALSLYGVRTRIRRRGPNPGGAASTPYCNGMSELRVGDTGEGEFLSELRKEAVTDVGRAVCSTYM